MPAVCETTHPDLALLRLHGRNLEAYCGAQKTAANRFDYAYASAEFEILAKPFVATARTVKHAHAMFDICMVGKDQQKAACLSNIIQRHAQPD